MARANAPQEREVLDGSHPGPQMAADIITWDLISTANHNYAPGWLRERGEERQRLTENTANAQTNL